MAAACLFVFLTICGWWLPRLIRRVPPLLANSKATAGFAMAVVLLSAAIGLFPLFLLIALIKNPQGYVTDMGVTKESVFYQQPVSFTWDEIGRVYCRSADDRAISSIEIVAKDGRKISFGNTGGVDFASMYELFENQLGPGVVKICDSLRRS
jgi:hypothetical protein